MLISEHVQFLYQFQGFQYTPQTLLLQFLMLQLQWESQRTFSFCHNLAFSTFKKLHFLTFLCSLSHTLLLPSIARSIIIAFFFYFINYHDIWPLSFDHTVWWNPIEFWNFCFQLHFLVHVHTKALPYWILAYLKTANIHTFLHYHASFCTLSGQVYPIHSLYEI